MFYKYWKEAESIWNEQVVDTRPLNQKNSTYCRQESIWEPKACSEKGENEIKQKMEMEII